MARSLTVSHGSATRRHELREEGRAGGDADQSGHVPGPLRRVPVQGRSVARVQRMLDACAELVDEVGYEGLTTTLLAERAGVAIGSVYQFFPDKRAIVQALTLRNLDLYLERLATRFAEDGLTHWWDAVDAAIDEYIAMHRTVPGFRTLHFGDVVDLHLLDDERDNNAVIVEQLAGLLVDRLRRADEPRLRFALAIAVEAADALIKFAFRRDPEGDERCSPRRRTLIREYLHRARCAPRPPRTRGQGRSEEGRGVLAPVGGHGSHDRVALHQVQLVDVLAQLAGLGVAEPHPVADPQRVGGRRRSAASAPRRRPRCRAARRPAGSYGRGQAARARPGRTRPSRRRARSTMPGPGRRTTDAAKNAAGRRAPGPVRVEQGRAVEPGAGGQLGDRRVGAPSRPGCRCRRR